MNTLIIVDCQNDFTQEYGSLYVPKADSAIEEIRNLLSTGVIDCVIFTVDWHPSDHYSFTTNGGQWPLHCIQYTQGSAIHPTLYEVCLAKHIPYQILRKGTVPNKEEYGAVSEIRDKRTHYELHSLEDVVILNKRTNVIVCGVAGDYCVLETLKQLRPLYPKVFMKGVASIDDGTALNKYMTETNIQVFE